MSFVNPNPNEPRFPFGGGTDNPGDDTSVAGGPTNVASTETGPLTGFTEPRHPPVVAGLAQSGTDTDLGELQAVPPSGEKFSPSSDYADESSDTGGPTVDPETGDVRVPGQDETVGETETTSGRSPEEFPEPTP